MDAGDISYSAYYNTYRRYNSIRFDMKEFSHWKTAICQTVINSKFDFFLMENYKTINIFDNYIIINIIINSKSFTIFIVSINVLVQSNPNNPKKEEKYGFKKLHTQKSCSLSTNGK